jgi:hypothetical protein
MASFVRRGVDHLNSALDAKILARGSIASNPLVADIDITDAATDFLWAGEFAGFDVIADSSTW